MTAATDNPLHLECPPWCVDTSDVHRDHGDWEACDGDAGPTLERSHIGPRFGHLGCFGATDAVTGQVTTWMDADQLSLTLVGVRALAEDAQQAAEWLEAIQR
ncbi:hypothetical protein KUV85_06760 [Nocardioides panacisoli]|uniref:hypothetical protein n=1 Tax=Nocardioides panacisoli TaxID=627624 RepID=UPI001C633FDF|nr:hypothetical protein [Nocardioides panacisoli]QYJ05374.1 hypothetical protein KUV85_06760 [Nocardioides panacisoli]